MIIGKFLTCKDFTFNWIFNNSCLWK